MQQQPEPKLHIDKYERTYLILAVSMMGVFFAALLAGAIIYGVRLPSAAEFINPLTLDQTEFASPGLRDRGNGLYDAYIVAQMWQFNTGSTERDAWGRPVLRVPQGAEVTFNIASRDVSHGFLIQHHNVNLQLLPGHVARQSVRFPRVGEFHVVCHEYCGRGHQSMVMVIIVEEPVDPA